MLKAFIIIAGMTLLVACALAQTKPAHTAPTHTVKKPTTAAHPNASLPTKVTGPGITTTTGLQYWDITVGTGEKVIRGEKALVQYTGWLTSGKKFDSSVGGPPFKFAVGAGEVIKGWDEGVAGMKVGGKRQLRIPPDLGYGAAGTPDGAIPPNATLIFDVQLVGTK
jgi:FKBP-type peptidyl-prolyl cis-trans isomerase